MDASLAGSFLDLPEKLVRSASYAVSEVLVSPGSDFSLTSLLAALGLSVAVLIGRFRQRGKPLRLKALARALFPRQITQSPSHFADMRLFLLNAFVFGAIFGSAVLSYQSLSKGVMDVLVGAFGEARPPDLPQFILRSLITLTLFLGYELGYWIDHYLSHRVPILWELHKVHHTATVLTPLTAWRVHPLDTLVFVNILALVTGVASGAAAYVLGDAAAQYTVAGNNILLVLFIHAYVHLQHSHLWIPFRGLAGQVFMSPAHHQVHHSADPAHFNKNFGSCLALFDSLFGTLHMPAREPERLRYGVEPGRRDVHSLTETLIAPLVRAASLLGRLTLRPSSA